MPDPSPDPKRPATLSSGIHVGDLAGERDVNVILTDVAGGDQIKITNSPGATVIKEAPRKLTREEQLAQRNRQTMLLKVKAYWIDGVLANSLHSKVIPLDMERKPDAVTRPRPWDMLWQHRDQAPQPLPPGTRIMDRFNYAAGDALLILGEPGSGKTTMLLELAGELLAEAQTDESLRIPVVFNLSSWAVLRPQLTEWLVSELQTLYLIPKKVAQGWVEQDDILPLLDGLDEVAQAHRAACINAINAYREAQGTPLVVCSRIADYEAIGEKLLLSDGLLLRPLTQEQINEYLAAGGIALDGVREALQQDEMLQEMAQSPLLLSIMAVAYDDQLPEQSTASTLDERHRQLFASYVKHQLQQRQKNTIENVSTTIHQLVWLAYKMIQQEETILKIEWIQPYCLPSLHQKRFYQLTIGLFVGSFVSLVFGLFASVAFGLIFGILSVLRDGLEIGLVVAAFSCLLGLVGGLLGGLVIGFGGWLLAWMIEGVDYIRPIEKVTWAWKRVTPVSVIVGLLSTLVTGVLFGLVEGLIIGSAVTFLSWLGNGIDGRLVELRTSPNEGLKNSARSAVYSGLVFGLIACSLIWLCGGVLLGMGSEIFHGRNSVEIVLILGVGGVGGGIGSALFTGLYGGGGLSVIQHYTLRFYLHRYGYLPLHLVPFLDLAAERLILQKVGGGYRFVHRLLQEYLASLYEGEGVNSTEL